MLQCLHCRHCSDDNRETGGLTPVTACCRFMQTSAELVTKFQQQPAFQHKISLEF